MKRYIFLLPILLCMIYFGVVIANVVSQGSHANRNDNNVISLLASLEACDLGEIWEGSEINCVLPIENLEDFPIEVEGFSFSCNCIEVNPSSFVIDSKERMDIRLRIDLSARPKSTDVIVYLRPRLKTGPNGEFRKCSEWKLKAKIRRSFDVKQMENFGLFPVAAQPLLPLSFPINIFAPVKSVSASVDDVGFSISTTQSTDPHTWTLRLTPPRMLPIGEFSGTVTIQAVLKDSGRVLVKKVLYRGSILSDYETVPSYVQVGGRKLNSSIQETVTIRSIINKPFNVIKINMLGDGLAADLVSPGKYIIRQNILHLGSQINHVQFVVETLAGPQIIDVPVAYTGKP